MDTRIEEWLIEPDVSSILQDAGQEEEEPIDAGDPISDIDEEEDSVEIDREGSESEEEGDDVDLLTYLEELPLASRMTDFISKNKSITWKKYPPSPRVRTRQHNIVTEKREIRHNAKNVTTVLDSWSLFFPTEVLETIVTHTNRYINEKMKPNYDRERACPETTLAELKAVIGLLYLAGLHKASHTNLDDIWARDGTGLEIFSVVMTKNRFKQLMQAIRFDDISTRAERREIDKLAPIRELFDPFVDRCLLYYSPGPFLTLDEMLEKFRGRCGHRVYIANKPAKYGLKLQNCTDAETFYTLNMEIYCGKQPEGPFKLSNTKIDTVKRLIAPFAGTHRNVTIDNWYTSVPLASILLSDYGLTMVGTIKKNKPELPLEFTVAKGREVLGSYFGFLDSQTIVSYVPRKGQVVNLISTMHHDDKIDIASGDKKKPEIITFYNKTEGGVDTVDHMKGAYTTARNCRRWPLRIFFTLLDISGINAHIILRSNNGSRIVRRKFLKTLAFDLIKDWVQYRSTITTLPKSLRVRISEHLGQAVGGEENQNPELGGRGRCFLCPRNLDKKSKVRCSSCHMFICQNHRGIICTNCVGQDGDVTEDE